MAIKIKWVFGTDSVDKNFIDRIEPRKAFWNGYMKMLNEGSSILNFYGAGGVGKTALLEKIEDEIKSRNKYASKECKYIKYDFSIGTDLREVLRTLKFQLEAYDCKFPFFDSGNYYYSLKVGKDITPLKAKSMMQKIPWVKEITKRLDKADNAIYKTYPFLRVARGFLEMADEVFQATAIPRAITTCFSVVDSLLRYYLESNAFLDGNHETVRKQLNAYQQEKDAVALYKYLPTLFAIDMADWIKNTGNKVVVIFDNYESLISETTAVTPEQLSHDWWLRGQEGLIFRVPNIFWTIAGRNELHWGEELSGELEQHQITSLSPEDSNWFLQRAGIANKPLREGLVQLTGGYPNFLSLCVDFYFEYKQKNSDEPPITKFGQKREEVIGRIYRYLTETNDDAAKDMLEFLCVLGVWTDEIAIDVGGVILHNFSRNTYKRVKNFSFIKSEHIENENISLTIFQFDKAIRNLLISVCSEEFIDGVKDAVAEHFQKKFADRKTVNRQKILLLKIVYLKLWAKFIVRFADNAEELFNDYSKFLKEHVATLTNCAQFNAAEEILKSFMSKLESLGDTETVAYTYFEMDLGWLRRAQGDYKEAYEITNSAYKKRINHLGEENIDTVAAMHKLAIYLSDLAQHEEALELKKKVLDLRKKILGTEHADTLDAMNNLAVSLYNLERYEEALALQKEVLDLRKEKFGEKHSDTLDAMSNLAVSLSALGRHEEALALQEKVLELCKETLGEKHADTLDAMNNLAVSLCNLNRHKEALILQEKVLDLRKEMLGEEHPETLDAMSNLAVSLGNLGRYKEALILQEKVLDLRREKLGEEHIDTLNAMNNLSVSLNALDEKMSETVDKAQS